LKVQELAIRSLLASLIVLALVAWGISSHYSNRWNATQGCVVSASIDELGSISKEGISSAIFYRRERLLVLNTKGNREITLRWQTNEDFAELQRYLEDHFINYQVRYSLSKFRTFFGM